MSVYFITGATGAIGSALVPILLADGHEVRLLIRADDDIGVQRRREMLLSYWQSTGTAVAASDRVHALRGDASLPRFGLTRADYRSLTEQASRIIHAAGAVRMNLPIDAARHSAVTSVEQIVTFAKDCRAAGRLEKVDIVSTVGVGGRLDRVPETWITVPRRFHNTYEQAKAEAEAFVQQESEAGLPITVHRPSMVVGDSVHGNIIHFQVFYHLCEFLAGRRTFGLFPPLTQGSLDIVPVDHVAGVLAWSSSRPDLAGMVLHACSGSNGSLGLESLRSAVRSAMRHHGIRLLPEINLSSNAFGLALKGAAYFLNDRAKRAIGTLPVFLDYLASRQSFDNDLTDALLAERANIVCPAWSQYLPQVLERYVQSIVQR